MSPGASLHEAPYLVSFGNHFPLSAPQEIIGAQARMSRPHHPTGKLGAHRVFSRTAAVTLLSSRCPEALQLFTRKDISVVRKQEDPEVEPCHASSWAAQKATLSTLECQLCNSTRKQGEILTPAKFCLSIQGPVRPGSQFTFWAAWRLHQVEVRRLAASTPLAREQGTERTTAKASIPPLINPALLLGEDQQG